MRRRLLRSSLALEAPSCPHSSTTASSERRTRDKGKQRRKATSKGQEHRYIRRIACRLCFNGLDHEPKFEKEEDQGVTTCACTAEDFAWWGGECRVQVFFCLGGGGRERRGCSGLHTSLHSIPRAFVSVFRWVGCSLREGVNMRICPFV